MSHLMDLNNGCRLTPLFMHGLQHALAVSVDAERGSELTLNIPKVLKATFLRRQSFDTRCCTKAFVLLSVIDKGGAFLEPSEASNAPVAVSCRTHKSIEIAYPRKAA